MEPKLLYWTGALVNMGVLMALAVTGVRHRRRGDVPRHRRNMLAAGALVVLFLASYVLKLSWLGREDMSTWSTGAVWILRVHELCVAGMLVGGAVAVWRGLRLGRTRNATGSPADAPAPEPLQRWHRGAGWLAVGFAVAGFLSASLVLLGMYQRAGFL